MDLPTDLLPDFNKSADSASDKDAGKDAKRVGDAEVATPTKPSVKRGRSKKSGKPEATKAAAPKTVAVRYMAAGARVIQGKSGETYRWSEPGAVLQVAAEDVEALMGLNRSGARACCGADTERTYFDIV